MRRFKTLVGLALLALTAIFISSSHRNQTLAAEYYSCKLTATCPGTAKCEGDRWMRTGDCSISCFKESGGPGELVFSGQCELRRQLRGFCSRRFAAKQLIDQFHRESEVFARPLLSVNGPTLQPPQAFVRT
jgi:hypothetical protein